MPSWGEILLPRMLGALLLLSAAMVQAQSSPALPAQAHPAYVGADTCRKCHAAVHQRWAQSLHATMLQPATAQSVKGNFAQSQLVLRGSSESLRHSNGAYYITESYLEGKPWEHRVEYALGNRRLQEYLTTMPDGSIIVLPATWDVVRKKWIHEEDAGNPEEASGIQVWNKSCYSCHVSGGEKNFDLQHLRYHTTWKDLGVGCEACHGPGSEHVAAATGAQARAQVNSKIVRPALLDPTRSSMVCAQCHSYRDIYAPGFTAGNNYYDFFVPVMEYLLPSSPDPAYWPDGRPRWLANEVLALWQSQCFLKGHATCVTCHSQEHDIDVAHNSNLRAGSNTLCTRCHTAFAGNISKHTHHAAQSRGSSCVGCHMPATIVSLNTRMRDHSMSIPVPENTVRHDIPNACNICHQEKTAAWAMQQVKVWYGSNLRQKLVDRADAFSEARQGNAAAVPTLLQILADSSQGEVIRANAAGYLGGFPNDPAAYNAVLQAFSDSQPLVRQTAALALRPRAAQRVAVAPALVPLLSDSARTVRVSAAIALVAMGVSQLPGEDGERLEQAKDLYRERAELDSDDPQQQLAAGKFFYLAGDMDRAAADFQAALKLDNKIPARYYLARTLANKGETESARQILQSIPPDDLQYQAAQRLLSDLPAPSGQVETSPQAGNTQNPAAEADFRQGQELYQNQNYGGALEQLQQALQLAPQAEWASKAQVYRAVCLEKLGRASEAEAAMKALAGNTSAGDTDLQLAYTELLYDTGRSQEALQQIDGFIAAVPKAPMAYFWRAKVLLQLQRTEEAAGAAEESIRLQPDLPLAHNLLVRIYQLQGRTSEAAQQAQWLREYQRRVESR